MAKYKATIEQENESKFKQDKTDKYTTDTKYNSDKSYKSTKFGKLTKSPLEKKKSQDKYSYLPEDFKYDNKHYKYIKYKKYNKVG